MLREPDLFAIYEFQNLFYWGEKAKIIPICLFDCKQMLYHMFSFYISLSFWMLVFQKNKIIEWFA